jgi:hypothetical protein
MASAPIPFSQGRTGELRDGGLEPIEAVVEWQEGMLA